LVDIITPNYTKATKVLIEKTLDGFAKVKPNEVPGNYIDIIDKINEDLVSVDYTMLTIYGVDKSKVPIVLDTVEASKNHKARVLNLFNT